MLFVWFPGGANWIHLIRVNESLDSIAIIIIARVVTVVVINIDDSQNSSLRWINKRLHALVPHLRLHYCYYTNLFFSYFSLLQTQLNFNYEQYIIYFLIWRKRFFFGLASFYLNYIFESNCTTKMGFWIRFQVTSTYAIIGWLFLLVHHIIMYAYIFWV